jgi:hypothetical protein
LRFNATRMSDIIKTKDHEKIRRWAEERAGKPAVVAGTEEEVPGGVLRIDFGARELDENLCEVTWDNFFQTFDQHGLRFVYEEATDDGEPSRFCRFVWS